MNSMPLPLIAIIIQICISSIIIERRIMKCKDEIINEIRKGKS